MVAAILIVPDASGGGPGCQIHANAGDPGAHTQGGRADGGHAQKGRGGNGQGRRVVPILGNSGFNRSLPACEPASSGTLSGRNIPEPATSSARHGPATPSTAATTATVQFIDRLAVRHSLAMKRRAVNRAKSLP